LLFFTADRLSKFCFQISAVVSVVIHLSLVQLSTPDALRGRVSALNYLFINASLQLGEFESGIPAALLSAVPAAALGRVSSIGVALLWMKLFPKLRRGATGIAPCSVPPEQPVE
jgi:hypothetical protein